MPEVPPTVSEEGRKVIVVGGGWAGFASARHLSSQGYAVTLLEASPNPGGLSTGWRTPGGRAVEAGMKGFWYQYKNIFALIEELNLPEYPLTSWTTSGFWNPKGLVTEAPIFSSLPRLPAMLGQFVHTFPLYWSLPLADRMTMLPFLASFVDFDSSEATYVKYDKMSAYELFKNCGVSKRCYEDFLKPTLLVGLFAPPEEISAAVMLETLYFYAIAHQNDFDVCWCKGSIAEKIFTPLVNSIEGAGGKIVGNQLVTGIVKGPTGDITELIAVDRSTASMRSAAAVPLQKGAAAAPERPPRVDSAGVGAEVAAPQPRSKRLQHACDSDLGTPTIESNTTPCPPVHLALACASGEKQHYHADAVVFAIGIGGMQKLVSTCPALGNQPDFQKVMNLKALDVIATRMWLDKKVNTRYPANVLAGFEPSAGATYFNLNEMSTRTPPGSVITADFYHANALLPLSDDAIIAKIKSHMEVCEPAFIGTKVVDSIVLRFKNAVTHFSPGSYASRPFQATTIPNTFLAGDWVKGVAHGANGLSQERAWVTGLIAANLVVQRLGLGKPAVVLDVEADEPHIAMAKQLAKGVRGVADELGIESPFL
ncbi:MAG: hypothetical protein WDW36_003566 [Sanguina aurantia]